MSGRKISNIFPTLNVYIKNIVTIHIKKLILLFIICVNVCKDHGYFQKNTSNAHSHNKQEQSDVNTKKVRQFTSKSGKESKKMTKIQQMVLI